jgi:hypothetical protein
MIGHAISLKQLVNLGQGSTTEMEGFSFVGNCALVQGSITEMERIWILTTIRSYEIPSHHTEIRALGPRFALVRRVLPFQFISQSDNLHPMCTHLTNQILAFLFAKRGRTVLPPARTTNVCRVHHACGSKRAMSSSHMPTGCSKSHINPARNG